MKKRWLIGAGLAVALLVIIFIVILLSQPEPVPAVQLKREDVLATLTVTGEVRADVTVAFSSTVNAHIRDITVDEGDAITPGQVLVSLDADEVHAQLAQARAQASQAQASLANVAQGTRPEQITALEARYRETARRIEQSRASVAAAQEQAANAARNEARLRSLHQQELASLQEYETARTQANVARQDVARLQADLAAVQTQRSQTAAQLAEARHGPTGPEIRQAAEASRAARAGVSQMAERLEDYRIVSSMQGIVTQRLQDEGELAVPGQPVLRAVNPQTLEIIGAVEENDLAKVQVNDRAYVILDAVPETALEARVKRVGSRVNPENGTVEVRLLLTPEGWRHLKGIRLLPGMTADINVITERLPNAMVVPATAVHNENGETTVYLFRNGRLVRQPVRAERISMENYRVITGVQPGDWVAAVAAAGLENKRHVKPVAQTAVAKTRPPSSMMPGR